MLRQSPHKSLAQDGGGVAGTTRGNALPNARHERFAREYLLDGNATQAAVRAGYASRNADVTGPRLLGKAGIARRVAELQAELAARLEISAERVLREVARIAFADPRRFFRPDGSLKAVGVLDDDSAAALASFETVLKAVPVGEGETEEVRRVRFWDKLAALNLLGKHLNLFANKMVVGEDLAAALDRARKRRPPVRAGA